MMQLAAELVLPPLIFAALAYIAWRYTQKRFALKPKIFWPLVLTSFALLCFLDYGIRYIHSWAILVGFLCCYRGTIL